MQHWFLFGQKSGVILLLVFLAVSVSLNIYQFAYYTASPRPPVEFSLQDTYSTGTWITGDVIGMGGINVFLNKGLVVLPEEEFNITVSLNVWAPYTSSETWNISFVLHRRPLSGEYPEIPITEETIIIHKSKTALTAQGSADPITLIAPPTFGIWIHRICTGVPSRSGYIIEFPITVCPSAPRGIIPIIPINPHNGL